MSFYSVLSITELKIFDYFLSIYPVILSTYDALYIDLLYHRDSIFSNTIIIIIIIDFSL